MNQTFSLIRFGRLVRKYFTDNRGQLLANIGLLIGGLVVLAVFVYASYPASVNDQRYILFFFIGWAAWYVFTVQQTTVLQEKERAINYLMQPASQFEKIALIGLVSGLGFFMVYISLFAVIDAVGVSFVNNRDWTPEQASMIRRQGGLFQLKSIFSESSIRDVPPQIWAFTALLHGFTLAFSLLVRRYTMPLVVVIAFGLLIFGFISNNFLLHTLTGSGTISSVTPFAGATAESPISQNNYRVIDLPQPVGSQLRYLVGIVAVVGLYITAYFRLKEREV